MTSRDITLQLPEELVQRAEAVGIRIEERSDVVIEAIEREIRRREAAGRLLEIAEQLRALPDELKPTPEEIDEAVRQARAEIAAERLPKP